ncbi:MAG TPA: PQQ-binding-like beta-propeller repeat protein [Sedimentisphaerales bacterium]|nr:PQQ-binding-like beta-propeller repeat protein [Sedimentisphaerales bacterium]
MAGILNVARVTIVLLPLIFSSSSMGADWPCFRGPKGNGISSETGINKDWNNKPPKELWRVDLTDDGFAGPSIADGKLYIVDNKDKTDAVRALDAATGKELWRFTYPEGGLWPFGHTVATPLVYGGKVYTWSRSGGAYCFNAATGEKLWDRNLVAEYPAAKLPDMKLASSAVADGQNIIFLPGGREATAVALDKDTGKTVWQSGKSKVSYATPTVATLNGRKQILIFVADGLFGLDPKDGKELWNLPWPTQYDDKKAPTPLIVGNRIFIATTEGGDTGLIDVKDDKPTVVWKHKEMQNHFATCVYYHDRIIGSSDPNFLMCLEPPTGKVLWKKDGFQCAQVLGIDDTVIALEGNTGVLVMIDPKAAEYKEIGRFTPLGGQMSWVAPIAVNGKLFVRSKTALACLDLK